MWNCATIAANSRDLENHKQLWKKRHCKHIQMMVKQEFIAPKPLDYDDDESNRLKLKIKTTI